MIKKLWACIRWVPNIESKSFLVFLFLMVRNYILMIAFATLGYFFILLGVHKNVVIDYFYPILLAFAVLCEEQSRWLFVRKTKNIHSVSAVKFLIYILVFENILFYIPYQGDTQTFVFYRTPSVLIHVFSSYLCYISYRYNKIPLLFTFAFLVHFAANFYFTL